jgi:hypothetical protein
MASASYINNFGKDKHKKSSENVPALKPVIFHLSYYSFHRCLKMVFLTQEGFQSAKAKLLESKTIGTGTPARMHL